MFFSRLSSICRGFLRAMLVLALFLPNGPLRASVSPPVKIRLVDPVPATPGEPYHGTLQIESGVDGTLADLQLVGEGWSVVEIAAPLWLHLVAREPVVLEFTAIPAEPLRPLTFRAELEDRPVAKQFDLSRQHFDLISDPLLLESRPASWGGEFPGVDFSRPSPRPAPPGERELAMLERMKSAGDGGGAASRNIRVYGQLIYRRRDGKELGVDGATVRVKDEGVIDTTLRTGRTDPDGYFDIHFTWDPNFFNELLFGDPDIYLEFESKNGAVEVESPTLERNYKWKTAVRSDFLGTEIDYGVLGPGDLDSGDATSNQAAFHILNTLTRTRRWLMETENHRLPNVDVQWPDGNSGAYYNPVFNEIHISRQHEWSEWTAVHEYGHFFIDKRASAARPDYCNGFGDNEREWWLDDCGHLLWCRENEHIAWSEGWPDWLADVVTRSLEEYGERPLVTGDQEELRECSEDGTYHDPWQTEGFFGALLRDIEDDTNEPDSPVSSGGKAEDALSLGTHEIFEVTVRDRPRMSRQFIAAFMERYPEYHEQLYRTALLNGFEIEQPEWVLGDSFEDDFTGGAGVPDRWTKRGGLWVKRSDELSVNTGSRAALRGLSMAPSVLGDAGSVDFFTLNFERELIHFNGSLDRGWDAVNLTRELSRDGPHIWRKPVVVRRTPDTFDVFSTTVERFTAGSREVIHYSRRPSTGWSASNLNRVVPVGNLHRVLGPVAAVSSLKSIDLFGIGIDGSLIRFSWASGGSWSVEKVDGPRFFAQSGHERPFRVHRTPDGTIHVVGVSRTVGGSAPLIHYRYEPSTRWVSPEPGDPRGRVLVQAGWTASTVDGPPIDSIHSTFNEELDTVLRDDGGLDVVVASSIGTDRNLWRLGWSYFTGWTNQNVSELTRESRGVDTLAAVSRVNGSLDVLATTVELGRTRDLLHFSWSASEGWQANPVWEAPNQFFRTIGLPVVRAPTVDTLEVFTAVGGDVGPFELWHCRWDTLGEWDIEQVSDSLDAAGEPIQLARLGHTDIAAHADAAGTRHVFGTRWASIDGSTESNLLHFSRVAGGEWAAEDLHGGLGGTEPFLVAGDPALRFRDVGSVSVRMRFLSRPDGMAGRLGGMFVCAQGPTAPETGNSGYLVYWSDESSSRGYHVELVRRGRVRERAVMPDTEPGELWRVVLDDAAVRLFVDGEEKAVLDNARYRSGYVGMWVGRDGQDVRFDDVSIGPRRSSFDIPLRINMGGPETVDSLGRVWLGDWEEGNNDPLKIRPPGSGAPGTVRGWRSQVFQSESLSRLGFDPESEADRSIFNSIRWDNGTDDAHFVLEIPVPNGLYLVNLYLTENQRPPMARRFQVEIEGVLVDDDVSIRDFSPDNPVLGWAGRLQFPEIAVEDGMLTIALLPCDEATCPGVEVPNPVLSALEIMPTLPLPLPSTPTGLTAVVDGQRVELDWDDNDLDELAIYTVDRATSRAGPWSVISVGNVAESRFVDEMTMWGASYYYRVRALNATGFSHPTAPVSVTIRAVDSIVDCFDSSPDFAGRWRVEQGSWSVTDDQTMVTRTTGSKSWVWARDPISGVDTGQTLVFEFEAPRVAFTGGASDGIKRHFGMMFCANKPTTNRFAEDSSGYGIYWIDRDWDFGLTLARWDGRQMVPLRQGTGALISDPPAVWRVELEGSTIRFVGDGVTLIEVEDDTYRGGFTGFFAWTRMALEIDSVRFGPAGDLPPCRPTTVSGSRRPGDCNQDGVLDISDAVCLLGHLFLGDPVQLPCSEPEVPAGTSVALFDHNGDAALDLSDAIGVLHYLFQSGTEPSLGAGCVEVEGCAGDFCSE